MDDADFNVMALTIILLLRRKRKRREQERMEIQQPQFYNSRTTKGFNLKYYGSHSNNFTSKSHHLNTRTGAIARSTKNISKSNTTIYNNSSPNNSAEAQIIVVKKEHIDPQDSEENGSICKENVLLQEVTVKEEPIDDWSGGNDDL